MTPRYFCGDDIHGPVKASTATTFKDLVDRHIMVPVPLPISSGTFATMSREQRDKAKSVGYLTAAVFRSTPSVRKTEHATGCNLIFLDIDVGKDGSTPAAQYVAHPVALERMMRPFSFAAYTTASSTPEKPRMRLVVDAHDLELAEYPAACRTIAARIGLLKVTKESTVPVQAMYLPSYFTDQDPELEHPVFARCLSGEAFTSADLMDSDGKPAKSAPRSRSTDAASGDMLEFVRAPVPEITIDVAREALGHIDPDIDYHVWTQIGMALMHQFPLDLWDDAYTLFDEWSSKGAKYKSAEETESKWATFRHTPPGRVPVTVRSILHHASAAGWDNGKVKEEVFARVRDWIKDSSTTQSMLLSKGVNQIAAAPMLSATEEDALLRILVQRARADFDLALTTAALRKDLAKAKDAMRDKAAAAEQRQDDPPWAKGLCYVSSSDEIFRHKTGECFSPKAFNTVYSRWLLPTAEDLIAMGKTPTPATLSMPSVMPMDYVLNNLKIPTVYGYEYNPAEPNNLWTETDNKRYINTYVRCHPEPDEDSMEAAGELFTGHIARLILEPEHQRTLIDMIAYMVQHPGKKIRWALLLQGAEGCGKGFICDAAAVVLGERHVTRLNAQAIFSGYREWATGSQLVCIDEVRVTGEKKHNTMNAMKDLVTNDIISVEQKYKDTRQSVNRTNYFLLTNHTDALPLTSGDRRYFVLKSPLQTRSQVVALGGTDYFDPLYAMLRDNAGGLRAFFENWKISPGFNPDGRPPVTRYLREMVEDTASEPTAMARAAIHEADNALVQRDMVSSRVLLDMLHSQGLGRLTSQGLGAVLRDENFVHVGRYMIGDEQHNIWVRADKTFEDPRLETQRRYKLGMSCEGGYLLI